MKSSGFSFCSVVQEKSRGPEGGSGVKKYIIDSIDKYTEISIFIIYLG